MGGKRGREGRGGEGREEGRKEGKGGVGCRVVDGIMDGWVKGVIVLMLIAVG